VKGTFIRAAELTAPKRPACTKNPKKSHHLTTMAAAAVIGPIAQPIDGKPPTIRLGTTKYRAVMH
jgi:hypothetical protein